MEAKEIKKLITEYGLSRNISYDPKYFTHNMPEFRKIAEMSFKAGYEEGNKEAYEIGVADGKVEGVAEGMREVVEWVVYCPKCGSYLPKNLNGSRTLKCDYCKWDGQAKLKEWGL